MARIFSYALSLLLATFVALGVACSESNTDEPNNGGGNDNHTIGVESVTLDKSSATLYPTESLQLSATVSPSNATNKAVAWSSSQESVATVSDAGLVTAVAVGEATITVATADGNKRAVCQITVAEKEYVAVESISLEYEVLNLIAGQSEQLVAVILPENASDKSVKWRSTNARAVSVDRNSGLVKALANGESTITATTNDGDKVATCKVVVTTPVEDVALNKSSLNLVVSYSEQLTASVLPETASNTNFSWSSSNESVATVKEGLVKAVAVGKATISAIAEDGGKVATCEVEVRDVDASNLLKAVSFNITTCPDGTIHYWLERRDAVVKFIKAEKPDVIGLQEVWEHQLNYLVNNLSGYSHYGVNKGVTSDQFGRTSIMYNTATVEPVSRGTFWLSATPETPSPSWNDEKTTSVEGTPGAMKYYRTCTWIKFRRKADNKVFFYFNTHLEFGYHADYNLGQTAREKGVDLIVSHIKQYASDGEAVIFGGDMNQVANDRCFNPVFNHGMVSARVKATEVLSEANRNSITWHDYESARLDAESKNQGPNAFNMIDHFFIKNCKVVKFCTIRDTNYGGEIDPRNNGGKYLADHYPVLMTIAL